MTAAARVLSSGALDTVPVLVVVTSIPPAANIKPAVILPRCSDRGRASSALRVAPVTRGSAFPGRGERSLRVFLALRPALLLDVFHEALGE